MKKIILNYVLLLLFATPTLMAGAIVGRVVHETDGSPAPDVSLNCIGRAESLGAGSKLTEVSTTTDQMGNFNMREIPPGRYSIYIKSIPDPAWTYRNLRNIIVSENQDTAIKLMLVKGQILSGIVQDCRGNSVGGARVHIEDKNVYFRTHSDATGRFSVHVPTGEYEVEVIDAPQQYPSDMEIQSSTGLTSDGYGPKVLVSITNKPPAPIHCVLYPTVTQETHPPTDPSFETNLLTVATRHIVAWILEGSSLPGNTPIKNGYSSNRIEGSASVVCDYLPKEVQISTNPCINRLSKPEYEAITKKNGWSGRSCFVTIVWTKTGDVGNRQGFIAVRHEKNAFKSRHEFLFITTPEGVKASQMHLDHYSSPNSF
jgi:hypothetical protein